MTVWAFQLKYIRYFILLHKHNYTQLLQTIHNYMNVKIWFNSAVEK